MSERLEVRDEAAVIEVRRRVREHAAARSLDPVASARLETAASELAHNLVFHASDGHVEVRGIERGGVPGVEVLATDAGPGIATLADAMRGLSHRTPPSSASGPAWAPSLGAGLAGLRRLADELDVDSRLGSGTRIAARCFARPAPLWEVGVYGRPFPGEQVSGDDAVFVREPDAVLAAVADGLGHGPEAREPARRAMAVVRAHAGAPLGHVLLACQHAVRGTRGAALVLARLDRSGEVTVTGLGNVAVHVFGAGHREQVMVRRGILGARVGPTEVPRVLQVTPHEVVVLATDGVRTSMDLSTEPSLLREHPAVVAHEVAARYARENDDVTVLAMRRRSSPDDP